METKKLKEIIDNFQNEVINENNSNYVSFLIIEALLIRKHQEFLDKTKEYVDYLGKKLNIKISNFNTNYFLIIHGTEKVINPFIYGKFIKTLEHTIEIHLSTGIIRWHIKDQDIKKEYIKQIEDDEKTKEYLKYIQDFNEFYFISKYYLPTNLSLPISIEYNINQFNVFISDDEKEIEDIKTFFPNEWLQQIKNDPSKNFYYYKNVFDAQNEVVFKNNEVKTFLNEVIIGKIYATLKVDISHFPPKLQEEIRQSQIYYKAQISNMKELEIQEMKNLQIKRIMKAYQLIKEATEYLSLLKEDMNFTKIKLDNINSVLLKNNGLPNKLGYKEFEDFFKNNEILRMLDLSDLDLTNVDIRGLDFSGTNIHIDPQLIYNKDMSYVNATDVKFSPFFDIFDDVILDGTIINDYEANININKVKSYNSDTLITHEVISILSRTK